MSLAQGKFPSHIFTMDVIFITTFYCILHDVALPNFGLLIKKRICSWRSKFFSLRVDPYLEELYHSSKNGETVPRTDFVNMGDSFFRSARERERERERRNVAAMSYVRR